MIRGCLVFNRYRLALAFLVVVAIAFARAPFTQLPDALFVSDGFGYYLYLPSLLIDRDLDFSNQVERIPYEGKKAFFQVSETTGRRTNQFPVGSAVLWMPFFVLAQLAVAGANAVGAGISANGFGYPYELPVYLGSFAYGLAGVWLMARAVRELFPEGVADLSVFAVLFATPLGYYLWFEPNMSHAVAFFLITLWTCLLLRIHTRRDARITAWLVLGIVLGLVGLVRPYSAILGLVAIPVAFRVCDGGGGLRNGGTWWRAGLRLVACCATAVVMLIPQLLVWQYLYGKPFVVPRGSGYEEMAWDDPQFLRFVVSIYAFFPALILATVGLFLWRRSSSDSPERRDGSGGSAGFSSLVAPWMFFVLMLFIYLVSGSRDWMLGTAFGQRRMVDWSLFYAIGLGLLLQRFPSLAEKRWLPGLTLFLAVANGALIVAYLLKLLPQYGMVV